MKRLLVAVLAVAPLALSVSAQQSSCLIVTSAEGHRFRNAMIAGALTGGIGLAAGAAFSGGRYEYRDSVNLPQSDYKVKYKGHELQKLQQQGVHVVVVNKHDKTGTEVRDARAECQNMTGAAQAPSPAAAANTAAKQATAPVQVAAPSSTTPTVAPEKTCVETLVDAQGHATCVKWQ